VRAVCRAIGRGGEGVGTEDVGDDVIMKKYSLIVLVLVRYNGVQKKREK
jgi:hypothetical protein